MISEALTPTALQFRSRTSTAGDFVLFSSMRRMSSDDFQKQLYEKTQKKIKALTKNGEEALTKAQNSASKAKDKLQSADEALQMAQARLPPIEEQITRLSERLETTPRKMLDGRFDPKSFL